MTILFNNHEETQQEMAFKPSMHKEGSRIMVALMGTLSDRSWIQVTVFDKCTPETIHACFTIIMYF